LAAAAIGQTARQSITGAAMPTSETREDQLAKVPLFRGLSHRQLRDISGLMTPLDLKAGRVLTREGEIGNEFLIVLEGEVEVVHEGEVITTCGPGNYFGEIALLDNRPRTATVKAKTDVVVEVLDRRELAALLEKSPEICMQIMATMAQRLADLDRDTS
jgi:CRP-like cAMP-binding protein